MGDGTKVVVIPYRDFAGSGLAAARPAAASKREGYIWHSTDTGDIDQVQSGAWATIFDASAVGAAHAGDHIPGGGDPLRWTANKLLKGAGAGSDPTEIDVPLEMSDGAAGDILVISADTERSSTSATYEKVKEIKIQRAGTYRIKFDIKVGIGQPSYGRIYKNGAAVGTEQTGTSDTYVTKSEDIASWAVDDLCQLYIKKGSSDECFIRNFRLYLANKDFCQVMTD